MNFRRILFAFSILAICLSVQAEERELFRKWRVFVGGAFNAGVRSRLDTRNMPVPSGYVIPAGLTKEKAAQDAADRIYGNGFIKDDDWTEFSGTTENWKLPVDAYDEVSGTFNLRNPYEYVASPSTISASCADRSSDESQFGVSVELSRELWINDEKPTEHRWGVDFAAAFSYFFRRDIYRASGSQSRVDHIGEGACTTSIEARDTMFSYIEETDPDYKMYPEGGMYGMGNSIACGNPALIMDYIGALGEADPTFRDVSSSLSYSAKGDYRELEMLFMLRPWYEIKDWWRVFAQIGVGVSWGCFDTDFYSSGSVASEEFAQWDCYGVAGLGTIFRYKKVDIMVDFLGRFLRDDLEVDGRYIGGRIERSDWGFRVMLGYEF